MLITENNKSFFKALVGVNAILIEKSIVALYSSTYGNEFTSDSELTRGEARNIVLKSIQGYEWCKDEDEDNILEKDDDKATIVIRKLIDCGWIVFEMNKLKSIKMFNFTRHGKKIAHLLYTMQDEQSNISRQKNVRTTRALLEAYQQSDDPSDLIDAITTSKNIILDLTDDINEIKEKKNELIKIAMESIDDAGDKFIDFIDNKFSNDFAVKFGEDSVIKHQDKINSTIELIIRERPEKLKIRKQRLEYYHPAFAKNSFSISHLLATIKERLNNACDLKLPALKREISTYISMGESIFKQTSSLTFNKNKEVYQFSNIIKEKLENEKIEELSKFGKEFKIPSLKIFDSSSIKIRKKSSKSITESVLQKKEKMPLDVFIKSLYEEKLSKALSYTDDEMQNYIEKHFIDDYTVSNNSFDINEPKELLIAMHALDYIAKNPSKYQISISKEREKNLYFEADSFIAERKN